MRALIDRLRGLGRDAASFGLIHGDFHSGNYVLDGDVVQLLDFDRCGLGYFLHDLALTLMELEEAQRASLLEGYEQVAPLPPGHPGPTDTFIPALRLGAHPGASGGSVAWRQAYSRSTRRATSG